MTFNARGTTVAIVQARMGSTRLPGKVLLDLQGQPMVIRQLQRLERARKLDRIVVATSSDPIDDVLTAAVVDAGFEVVRGPVEDVLARYVHAIDETRADVVVRLTADCPLASPSVIDAVVSHFHGSRADYVSNTMKPTYPDGLDVEVVMASVLKDVASVSTDTAEREHVTLGVYRRTDAYRIENVIDPSGRDNSALRWTVDSQDDFDFVREVYRLLLPSQPEFEYDDVLDLLATHPELNRTESDARRNAALDGLDTGAMQHPGAIS
jgi:spore coat polysaccharide biosynthesis protein SpsF